MVSTNSFAITSARIANFYTTNGNELAKSMIRIAMNKKFSKPKDDIPGFFRSQKITQENRGYSNIRRDLGETLEMMTVADKGGAFIFDDLTRMKSLIKTYYDTSTTADEKSMIKAEFNGVKDQITFTLANTVYEGKNLIQDTSATSPLRTVDLNPNDFTQQFTIDFTGSDVTDVSGLNITDTDLGTDTAAVDAQMGSAGSYLAKVSGYIYGLNAQYNLVEKKILSNQDAQSALEGIDSAAEVTQMLKRSIQQQASVAMFSQAQMARQSVLMLIR
jgi:flagellin